MIILEPVVAVPPVSTPYKIASASLGTLIPSDGGIYLDSPNLGL